MIHWPINEVSHWTARSFRCASESHSKKRLREVSCKDLPRPSYRYVSVPEEQAQGSLAGRIATLQERVLESADLIGLVFGFYCY